MKLINSDQIWLIVSIYRLIELPVWYIVIDRLRRASKKKKKRKKKRKAKRAMSEKCKNKTKQI